MDKYVTRGKQVPEIKAILSRKTSALVVAASALKK